MDVEFGAVSDAPAPATSWVQRLRALVAPWEQDSATDNEPRARQSMIRCEPQIKPLAGLAHRRSRILPSWLPTLLGSRSGG
jgi:hypothetical protein